MEYFYRVVYMNGKYYATLNKGDDKPIKKIGLFRTEPGAKLACKNHYDMVCEKLGNLGKPCPTFHWI